MPRRKTNEEFVKEVYELVGDEYEFLEEYKGIETKILCKHKKCNHKWKIKPSDFIYRKIRCQKCYGNKKKTTKEFHKEVYNLTGREYTFFGEYKNNKTKMKYRHNKCGYEGEIRPNSFLKKPRCPKCSNLVHKDNNYFIKEIKKLVGDKYTFLEKYKGSKTKIKCRHNECGYIWKARPDTFLQGYRCPKCNLSKGETKINKYLEANNVDFETEYFFNDLTIKSYLRFDFAVKKNGKLLFLIEYDGNQHFNFIHFFDKKEPFRFRKYKDRVKTAYCINNNIPLLRIPYFKKHLIEKLIDEMLEKFDLLETV